MRAKPRVQGLHGEIKLQFAIKREKVSASNPKLGGVLNKPDLRVEKAKLELSVCFNGFLNLVAKLITQLLADLMAIRKGLL